MKSLDELMNAARRTAKAADRAKKGGRKHYPNGKYKGRRMAKHRIAAEKALGHPLPPEAIVHHIDGDRNNYANSNLVICPNKEYHELLHKNTTQLFYREAMMRILAL